ncbi:hypothetical protein CYK37_20625 [Mesorhizobium loti]|nr:hypothetical protein CYK37_20625 [Mesorhizobium loti]
MNKKRNLQRVQLLMSEPELHAVDDFRFTNRIPSRAQALRALCSNGLQPARQASLTATDVVVARTGSRTIIRVSVGSESFDLHLSADLRNELAAALSIGE